MSKEIQSHGAQLPEYRYGGARAMVLLHEHHLRRVLETWSRAKASGLDLPETSDPDYASLDVLLRHVCRAARGYMVWICEVLGLPDPKIRKVPEAEELFGEVQRYLEHLLERWRVPLTDVDEERFYRPEFPSRWKTKYCVDAMLEHAVMHPIRHEFQLNALLEGRER